MEKLGVLETLARADLDRLIEQVAMDYRPGAMEELAAQDPAWEVRLAQTTVETQRITGTVKATTDNGIVVVGRDTGNTDREWAFVVDAGTRIEAGGQARAASDVRQGDSVTVTYTNRDGKVVAQIVTVNPR